MAIKQIILLLFIVCPLYGGEKKTYRKRKNDGLHLYTYSSADVGTYGATRKARKDRSVLQQAKKIREIEQDAVQNTDTMSTLTPQSTNTLPLPFSHVKLSVVVNVLLNNATTTDHSEYAPKESSQVISEECPQYPHIQKAAIAFLLNNPDEPYQLSCEFIPSMQTSKLQ